MKTSISPPPSAPPLSRSNRTVEAGRALTASAMRSTGGAGLRLHCRAPVDAGDPGQQVIAPRVRRRSDGGCRLALCARGNHAAVLQDVFAHREPGARLLLVADQRQMRVEQVMRSVALARLRQFYH